MRPFHAMIFAIGLATGCAAKAPELPLAKGPRTVRYPAPKPQAEVSPSPKTEECKASRAARVSEAKRVLQAYNERLEETAQLYRWARAHCTGKGALQCTKPPPEGLTLEDLRARVAEVDQTYGVWECAEEDQAAGLEVLVCSGSDAVKISRVLALP